MNNDEGFFDQLMKQHASMVAPVTDGANENASVSETSGARGRHPGFARSKSAETISAPYSGQSQDAGVDEPVAKNNGMPPEARRALVSLLRQGVILAARKANLFDAICRYQVDIRRHLSDMYLKLVLDERSGVAFVASVDEEDKSNKAFSADNATEEAVSLISRRTLSLFDTLLLLVLRKHYQERETSGEQKVVIDIERIESNLTPFLPLTNSSKSDRKKLSAALQRMIEKRIVSSVRGSEDRYEITAIIRYVVNAEFLEGMLAEYQRLASEAGVEADSDAQGDFQTDASVEQEAR